MAGVKLVNVYKTYPVVLQQLVTLILILRTKSLLFLLGLRMWKNNNSQNDCRS